METMAAVATAEAEAEAAVEGAIAGDRQPLGGQSLAYLHRPPTNSNTHGRNRSGDTDDDDVLDAEDRHVNTMLSLKSKSIAEYPPFAVDSPGGQSNYSVAMSDSDFRIKQHLDSRVRSFHEMAAVTDHHQQQQQQQQSHQYLRSSKYAQDAEKEGPEADDLEREVERASSMAKLGKRRRRRTGSTKRIRMSHVENLDSSDVGGESIPTPLFVHMPNSAPVQGTFPDVVVIHPGDHISTESPDILAPQSSQLTDSTGTNPSARQPFDLGDGNPVTHISQTPDDASHANATVDHGATPVVTQSVSVPSTNHSDITQATQEIEQTSDSDENDDDMFEDASEVQSQIGTDGSKQLEPGMENVDNAGKPDVPLDKNEGDSGSDSDLSLPTPPTPTQKDINHLLGSSASIIDSAPEQSVTGRANSENADDDTLSGGDKNGDTDETGDKDDALSRHSANLTESDSSSDSSPDSKVDPDAVSSSNSSVSSDADSEADTDSDEAAADESADDATNDADNIGSSQIAESVAAAVAVAAATRSKSGWTRRESESGEDIIEKKQPTVDVFDDEWKIGDREVSMDEHTGKLDMPALLSSPHRPTTRSQTYIVSNEATSAEKHAAAGRKRRVSSSRRLSTCQRLLQLQQQMNESADGSPGLGIMLDSSALGSNGTSGINGATPMSVPSSPSRRATFSGAMRVFGEGEPEVSDRDRLVYMRRLKGLIHGTELTAREGLRVLYFCTGNWANARKQILQGPDSLPEECVWNPEDDSILRSDSSTDKVEDLRNRRGNLEVYRRMQFLNTFHGTGMSV
ncbi:hypothetical protein LPJ53_002827 [Coemansia erecta]|uniref:TRF2-interacting telomeric protein/Rap1 C-terminal domain-containing protein n=1 Tax=Coemansia erecta TaxID=147472 RepID=A0A9W8CSL7_9FUNG|nr:hypothetical protein LPJ53_002827 [Coemansia erecta]